MDPVDGPILASLLGNYMSHCKHFCLFNVVIYKSLLLDRCPTQGHYDTLLKLFVQYPVPPVLPPLLLLTSTLNQ